MCSAKRSHSTCHDCNDDGDGDDGDGDDGVDMWAGQGRYPDQFPTAGAAAPLHQSQPSKELSHFDNDILIRQTQFYWTMDCPPKSRMLKFFCFFFAMGQPNHTNE